MKKIFVLLFVLFGTVASYSQNIKTSSDSDKIYTIVRSQPKFPGDINKWLGEHIVYPDDARQNNLQGTVYLSFIVEKNGSFSSIKIIKGIQGGRSLENEALRVVCDMPTWTPGTQNGVPVKVQYTLPIHFTLVDNNAANQKKN